MPPYACNKLGVEVPQAQKAEHADLLMAFSLHSDGVCLLCMRFSEQ